MAFLLGISRVGFEPGSAVNQAPVGPESRTLSEAAAECSTLLCSTKQYDHPFGWSYCLSDDNRRVELGMVVNCVPVAPKSHALSEAAAECSTLICSKTSQQARAFAFALL